MNSLWLEADWPAPANVRTCITTRQDGHSQMPWDSFNLGDHVGDDPQHVAANRLMLQSTLGCRPAWLEQTHSVLAVRAQPDQIAQADASWTDIPGIACAIMTADCLPVLLCDRSGSRIAAAHAGWRGLANGVLEQTVDALGLPATELMAWMGPAIGPQAFEVGPEVREVFIQSDTDAALAFKASSRPDHFLADIYHLARLRLQTIGVSQIYGGGLCTLSDPDRFYSYRRDGQTGRFASLIWLT
ncbi:MAG TPA: peptidoglycan editing factor PgeF [Pseudomonas xinjiangensis]|uniref:Purine nucleoside phosphorylase n=2 Tax=root TaxID=1 RepID=A0A7V1FSL4_9GAMM|nr:peptidoglycan editing factor PgeF [Halopseudomonas xinjiangensis]HEC49515.1 peptidoglycan editing factor PgeF [Halopseudomonas xinjiangensis]